MRLVGGLVRANLLVIFTVLGTACGGQLTADDSVDEQVSALAAPSGPGETVTINCSRTPDSNLIVDSFVVTFALSTPDTQPSGTNLGGGNYSRTVAGQLKVVSSGSSAQASIAGLLYSYNISKRNIFSLSLDATDPNGGATISNAALSALFTLPFTGFFKPSNNNVLMQFLAANDPSSYFNWQADGNIVDYGPARMDDQGYVSCTISRMMSVSASQQ